MMAARQPVGAPPDLVGLCMARRGDAGPYAPGNVYCATHAQNTKDYYDRKCPVRFREVVAFSAPEGTQARIDALRGEEAKTAFLRRLVLVPVCEG
jgi:hypothetical protein